VPYLCSKRLRFALSFVALSLPISKAYCGTVMAHTKIGRWAAQCEAAGDQDVVCNAQYGPLFYQAWKNEPSQRDFYLAHINYFPNKTDENIDREYDQISIDGKRYTFARLPLSPIKGVICYSDRTTRLQDVDYDRPKKCVSNGSGLYAEIAPDVWVEPRYLIASLLKAEKVRLRYKEFNNPKRKYEIVQTDTPPNEWHHRFKIYDVRQLAEIASWCEHVLKKDTATPQR